MIPLCPFAAYGPPSQALILHYRVREIVFDSMGCCMSDATERALCGIASDFFLQRFGYLRSLSLCRNGLTEMGAELVARGLRFHLCALEVLHLADNDLRDASGVMIGEALAENR